MAGPTVVSLRGVGVRRRGVPVLADVDLDLAPGTLTALIGPSGSGKTTLLRAICRLLELDGGVEVTGSLRYRGEDLYGRGVDPAEVRRRIGYVGSVPSPFERSVRDNVAFGLRLQRRRPRDLDGRIERALRAAQLWEEVADRLDDPAPTLSMGQQQRLCLARTLAVEPEVLLLDDVTAALDLPGTLRLEQVLRQLKHEVAVLLVSHDLPQVARISDATALLGRDRIEGALVGRLVEVATTERLFTGGGSARTEAYLTGRSG